MTRAISFAKYRKVRQSLRRALDDLAVARREALAACAANPRARARDDKRPMAIGHYCGARRWVAHWRNVLAESAPMKFANQHSYKVTP